MGEVEGHVVTGPLADHQGVLSEAGGFLDQARGGGSAGVVEGEFVQQLKAAFEGVIQIHAVSPKRRLAAGATHAASSFAEKGLLPFRRRPRPRCPAGGATRHRAGGGSNRTGTGRADGLESVPMADSRSAERIVAEPELTGDWCRSIVEAANS